jgi:hypothetical protein
MKVIIAHVEHTKIACIIYQWNRLNEAHEMVYTSPGNNHLSEITYFCPERQLRELRSPKHAIKLVETGIEC